MYTKQKQKQKYLNTRKQTFRQSQVKQIIRNMHGLDFLVYLTYELFSRVSLVASLLRTQYIFPQKEYYKIYCVHVLW